MMLIPTCLINYARTNTLIRQIWLICQISLIIKHMPNSDWFHSPGYDNLLVYKISKLIFDLNSEFCDLFINKRSRTHDQMIQAARSSKQNIVEGSLEKSLKSYIKLVGVSRASFEELVEDYHDYLRLNKLVLWEKTEPRVGQIHAIRFAD